MDDVLHCIASRFGESAVRARWRDWVVRFTRMAAAFEEVVYGASALWIGQEEDHAVKGHGYVWPDEGTKMRDLMANAARIEGWRNTRSYYAYVQVHYLTSPLSYTSHLPPLSLLVNTNGHRTSQNSTPQNP